MLQTTPCQTLHTFVANSVFCRTLHGREQRIVTHCTHSVANSALSPTAHTLSRTTHLVEYGNGEDSRCLGSSVVVNSSRCVLY